MAVDKLALEHPVAGIYTPQLAGMDVRHVQVRPGRRVFCGLPQRHTNAGASVISSQNCGKDDDEQSQVPLG
jgi:hypothetical protein